MPHRTDRLPEPWLSFLRALDRIASEPAVFHCIGGFVVTRCYGFGRETADMDVLSIVPNTEREAFLRAGGEGRELHRKYHVYLDYVTVLPAYPEDYEDRLREIFAGDLEKIRLLVPEAHDLALMKLGRNIERDREDVKYLAQQGYLDPKELEERYQREMRPYIAQPEREMDATLRFWLEMIQDVQKQ